MSDLIADILYRSADTLGSPLPYTFFSKLLNMSIPACVLAGVVILLRLCLKKLPRKYICILWAMVGLRLICPFGIASPTSVFNLLPTETDRTGQLEVFQYNGKSEKPLLQFEVPATVADNTSSDSVTFGTRTADVYLPTLVSVWLCGTAGMLLYAVLSVHRLKKKTAASILLRENIYICDAVGSPFILGVLRPRIMLPSGLEERTKEYVLTHERAHLRRHDHLWKPLAYLLLSVYWFHPILWAAYLLLCRDIEAACDESVLGALDRDGVASYSEALLDCAVRRRRITVCPVAFGETNVKGRVKRAVSYKKATLLAVCVAVLVCATVAVCFLTDPAKSATARITPEEEAFFHQCVMEHNADLSSHADDTYPNEAHGIFGVERKGAETTVYAWVLYQRWSLTDAGLRAVSGSHIATAVTMEQQTDGSFLLAEYWEPRDGSYYPADLKAKLPHTILQRLWKTELDESRFDATQKDAERHFGFLCDDKAVFHGKIIAFQDGAMLVTQTDGAETGARFLIPIENMPSSPEPQLGEELEVLYNGCAVEEDPAQLCGITSIRIIRRADGTEVRSSVYLDTAGNELTVGAADGSISVNGTVYYPTERALLLEPDIDSIRYVKLPLPGGRTVGAWLRIADDTIAAQIGFEWYEYRERHSVSAAAICIDDILYLDSGKELSFEPEESSIEYAEIPFGKTGMSITAFVILEKGVKAACRVGDVWYEFPAQGAVTPEEPITVPD